VTVDPSDDTPASSILDSVAVDVASPSAAFLAPWFARRPSVDLSSAEARRIALAAQGFRVPRPTTVVPDRRHMRRVIDRVGLIQIDSVNVLARSHYLPFFARLGPYPARLLDALAYDHRELFEYWGHEASFIPMGLQPLFRWRMARAADGEAWGGLASIARELPEYVERIYAEVRDRGPLGASALAEPGARAGAWWGWADGKRALEWLFWTGRVTTAGRRNFERLYDLTERVIPASVLALPTPPEDEAHRALLRIAARSLGVATAGDLADYFRIRGPLARPRIAELVEDGALVPVRVAGWSHPAFLDPSARLPRRVDARALLSPFDSLVWERSRTDRLFGFHLRLELYTPAPKRVHGYYVLPFLLGDRLAARVDLKADRKAGRLLALGAFTEAHAAPSAVAAPLAGSLREMADWLGLESVVVGERGDLVDALRMELPAALSADASPTAP